MLHIMMNRLKVVLLLNKDEVFVRSCLYNFYGSSLQCLLCKVFFKFIYLFLHLSIYLNCQAIKMYLITLY